MLTDRQEVLVRGEPVRLALVEYKLLELFLENQGKALERGYLITVGWRGDVTSQNKSLDVHIQRLREKVEKDPSNPDHIITIRNYGYRFDPQPANCG